MSKNNLLVFFVMITFLLGGGRAGSSFASEEVTFKRIQPKMVEVQYRKHFHWEYAAQIPRKKAEALYNYIHQKYKQKNGYVAIFACPGRPKLFVIVSSVAPGTQKDYGKRFLLIKEMSKGYALLDKSHGQMDSYILRPTFFINKNRIIVLGDTGTEYSWGVATYEIKNDRLKDLGGIGVAKLAEDNTINPIPDALVKSSKNRLRVEFHTDLYFNRGMSKEGAVKRVNGRPFVFEHDGKKFQLQNNK